MYDNLYCKVIVENFFFTFNKRDYLGYFNILLTGSELSGYIHNTGQFELEFFGNTGGFVWRK